MDYLQTISASPLVLFHRMQHFRGQQRQQGRDYYILMWLWLIIISCHISCVNSFILSKSMHPSSRRVTPRLFGIKGGFRAWYESQFPNAIVNIQRRGSHEEFDHVLIDINPLLHISVRRAKSDDHALALMFRELNSCVELASPRKSLVLAMDGSPSAAKLATSRKRRLSTLMKTEWKQFQLERLRKSKRLSLNDHQERRLRERYVSEVETLKITPGTKFMDRANQALLYWAWQRMLNPVGPLSKVSIFISTSEAPGEGEVKLLDWILQKRPQGSVGIIGGDSDLVLEALVVPPSLCTHNVFVLLPNGGKAFQVVSLWETTRHLARLLPQLKAEDIMFVRTDMVLLLILNGNDYLPKLRGLASGFNKIFNTYINVVKEWLEEGKGGPFFVDPQSLVFHREFAIDFLGRLRLQQPLETASTISEQRSSSLNPLAQLNNLLSLQFMPKPVKWKVLLDNGNSNLLSRKGASNNGESYEEESYDSEEEEEEEEAYQDEDAEEEEFIHDDEDFSGTDEPSNFTLRLTLGKEGSQDFHCYEIAHPGKMKDAKTDLARIALEDLLGPDYGDFVGNDMAWMNLQIYPWELDHSIDSDCELYLEGLLWNLQTYQDGICSDYGYNYGKRMSPTANELMDYFQKALNEGRNVGHKELLHSKFRSPMKKGVACLAAMPSQLRNLIARPYADIPSERVESLYGQCVSPVDNSFDMEKFKASCAKELAASPKAAFSTSNVDKDLRMVGLGEDYWTVVFRSSKPVQPPFHPPDPVIEKFSRIRTSRMIKAARFAASTRPRERSVWLGEENPRYGPVSSAEIDHCNICNLLSSCHGPGHSVFDVQYWIPFVEKWAKKTNTPPVPFPTVVHANGDAGSSLNSEPKQGRKKRRLSQDELERRMKEFNTEIDPTIHPDLSDNGQSALDYLNHLNEIGMIDVEWKSITPSPTQFASVSPSEFESVELIVRRGDKALNATFDDEVTFQYDRELTRASRQKINQYLASLALTRLLARKNKNWYKMDIQDLKNTLLPDYEILTRSSLSEEELKNRMQDFNIEPLGGAEENTEGWSALQHLLNLKQEKFVDFEFEYERPSPTEFASVSPQDFERVQMTVRTRRRLKRSVPSLSGVDKLVFMRDRLIADRNLKQVKEHLAGMALTQLLPAAQQGNRWSDFSFQDLRTYLQRSGETTTRNTRTTREGTD